VIAVALADDHAVVRTGLRLLLGEQDGLEIVAEAGDVDTALAVVEEHRPNVLVLDLNMPGSVSSLDAIPRIRSSSPTQIVVLTMQEDAGFARRALDCGVAGYVLKDAADNELVDAIRCAACGDRYVSFRLRRSLSSSADVASPVVEALTEREAGVLRLIALGHTNAEIGQLLDVSVRTVESHRAHIQRKLGRSRRSELVRYALDHGILRRDTDGADGADGQSPSSSKP